MPDYSLACNCCSYLFCKPRLGSENTGLSKPGEVAGVVLNAADDYNPGISKNEIMLGFEDGTLREKEPASMVQALVMLSRAFGELPSPRGDNLRRGVFDQHFNDVPPWAAEEVDKLKKQEYYPARLRENWGQVKI